MLSRVPLAVRVVQKLARAKMGGKSLDRGSVPGSMSQLSQRRECAESRKRFAGGWRVAEKRCTPRHWGTLGRSGMQHSVGET